MWEGESPAAFLDQAPPRCDAHPLPGAFVLEPPPEEATPVFAPSCPCPASPPFLVSPGALPQCITRRGILQPWFPILQMRGTEVEDLSATFSGVPGQWWLSWALGQLWSDSPAQVFSIPQRAITQGERSISRWGRGKGQQVVMFGQEGRCVRLRLRSPWKHQWGFPDGGGGNGMVGGGAKAPGCEAHCLWGKHTCLFLPASILTS